MIIPRELVLQRARAVEDRLAFARFLYDNYREFLAADGGLVQALNCLRHRARAVSRQMAAMHIGVSCHACATRPDGGCCGVSMAEETDELQLLLNLLAGVEIAMLPHDDGSCPFLGSSGCQFLFKPMFCLNYLCYGIRRVADSLQLKELERLSGVQLQQQHLVERYITG